MNNLHSLTRLTDLLPILLDEHVGIIDFLKEQPIEVSDPNCFRYGAKACNTLAFSPNGNFAIGGGASTNPHIAMARAIGECVERYCAAIYDSNELRFTSYKEAGFPCVPPNEFATYTAEQTQDPLCLFQVFDERSKIFWTSAQDLMTGEAIYVPEACVHIPYYLNKELGEKRHIFSISTGLACHSSFEEAVISGIYEVIERDVFMIMWQAMLSPPKIRLDSLSSKNQRLIQHFQRAGREIFLLNITMDTGIPSVLAIQRSTQKVLPALTASAAVALNPEEAVEKSLEELILTDTYMKKLITDTPFYASHDEYYTSNDKETHMRYWCRHEYAHHADFLIDSKKEMDLSELPCFSSHTHKETLEILVNHIHAAGYRVLVSDLTTEDIDSLGLSVVRVVIPGFQPLCMGYHQRVLGGKRLWEIPQKLGFKGITQETGDNPYLHPYP
jgi:ribosomal protein S12 methylthiotransferase accessory factor